MTIKEIFFYIWLPFSVVLNAISLINLQKDLFPALHKWSLFFENILLHYNNAKEIVFYPLLYVSESLFSFSIPSWVTTYLTIGIIFSTIMVFSIKEINSKVKSIELFYFMLAMIVLYPPFLVQTLFLDYDSPAKVEGKVIIAKYGVSLVVVVILLLVINHMHFKH